jgi:hypothetical protein
MSVVAAPRRSAWRRERMSRQPRHAPAVAPPARQQPFRLDWLLARWSSVLDGADRALVAIERADLLPAAEIHRRRQSLRDERRLLDQLAAWR